MFNDPAVWLPLAFAALMGLSILIYVVLDGFDLGVGILFPGASGAERDRMVASIGPFWDANETWLVLAIGLLLVAFPIAHGMILTALYLPVALMLVALILRGVAFEFRAKAEASWKPLWDRAFFGGSLLTALTQGYMLGLYVTGLESTLPTVSFGLLTAVCVAAGYALMGAAWLIIKTEGDLQRYAVKRARLALVVTMIGFLAISVATPLVSPRIFTKWFSLPEILFLSPLPITAGLLAVAVFIALSHLPDSRDRFRWVPFAGSAGIMVLAFFGLAYSFYPFIVPDRLTIYAAAAAPESLAIILFGALIVVPVIIAYSAFAYWVFRGKAGELRYD
ncbi:cytochrome d ubiquinol oxidase subunit II [Phreatobacter oligotrophus]|jgi:cytochrome bd ubiquinol oxidase subunit II|uniref:Cytochrome bd-I ubiquinol oxidase subunit 2 apoprotein n=1 Tax=Phreatobacter oligotrophus TaxID=1122261 RepID=A0A2T4ZEB5_9HYPH|nr:cytochrome d ubiquinol oxidase subunit II [Phreatobacter oligotrophus]MBX9991010.1 cytochrome d ubiquinol oxidase subunit II [Phreatobacter oligotrophus]PTM60235.1 cytochrome bd-I ubiquinol oxidase subunit 2 apoprotein [Phreatobacter oligotrophus]